MKKSLKGSGSNTASKVTTGTHHKNDHISKLKQMNSSLQKSYHTQQQSIHHEPFLPSSAVMKSPLSPSSPNSKHKYWYGEERSAKKNDVTFDAFYGDESPSSPTPKNVGLEESPSRRGRFRSPEQRLASINHFAVDASPSTWKSEQNDNYRTQTADHTSKVAGVSTRDKDTYSMSWNTENRPPTKEKKDSPDRVSEHDQKFKWPPAAERVIYTNPDKQFTPFPKDITHINPANWQSEYDDTNSKLKDDKGRRDDAPTAGIVNQVPTNANPKFYAWETVDESQRDKNFPYNYNMGNSEHKNKYKKWPISQDSENHSKGTTSHVFPPSGDSDYAELRQNSTHKTDFPKYSEREVAASSEVQQPRQENPRAFAWSLLDKENEGTFPPNPRSQPPNGVIEETEYTRKFNWPPVEALQHPHANKDSMCSSEMQTTLEHGHLGLLPTDRPRSEQQQQFVNKDVIVDHVSASASRSVNPPQFAWSLVNGKPISYEDDMKPKPRKPLHLDKDSSEHTEKYKWPVGTHLLVPQKPLDENDKYGSIYAVDPEELNSAKWQSEYDEKCAELRKKQKAINATSDYVAGKPSASRDHVPANFAWELPRPVTPSDFIPRHAKPTHFNTEYDEKFLNWPSEKIDAKHNDGERLNLFEVEGKAAEPLKSEYRVQFAEKSDLVDKVTFKPSLSDPTPPQFAWQLDDIPQPPPQKSKKSAPVEKTEYESSFAWRQRPPSPPREPKKSAEAPIALDEDQESSGWKTEYNEKAEKAVANKCEASAAGLVSIKADDVPSFFAWTEAEEKKPLVTKPTKYAADVVPTEYQEKFKPTHVRPEDIPKRFGERQNPDWFHMDGALPLSTEYDSKFQWKSGDVNSRFQAPVESENCPPNQFAWSLVDGHPKPRPKSAPPRTGNSFKGASEYNSKFNWSSEDYKHINRAQSNQVDHFSAAATLRFDPQDDTTAQWESEYDSRCEQLRQKQQQVASKFAVRDGSTQASSAPAFFAWNDTTEKRPVEVISRPNIPTETTEYREKFITKSIDAAKPATPAGGFGRSQSFAGNHLTTSKQVFDSKTEYADQYAPEHSSYETMPVHHVTKRDKQQPSLRNTILDLDSYMPERTVTTRTNNSPKRGSKNFGTEQSDKFLWPQAQDSQSMAATQKYLSSTLGSQSTLLPGGMVSHVLASKSSVPLTEAQQKFSWPDPAQIPKHEPHLSPRRKAMKSVLQHGVKRYSLMKKPPAANIYRRPERNSNLFESTFSRTQQVVPVRRNKEYERKRDDTHDDSFSIPSELQDNGHLDKTPNRFSATNGTVMSQDSLCQPVAGASLRVSSKSGKTDGTELGSPVSIADSTTLDSTKGNSVSVDVARKEIFDREQSPIRGLRSDATVERSRSAPPRQRIGQIFTAESGQKYRVYRDESPSNPVLMYRRYPGVTDRQATRWSTETKDSFRWRSGHTGSP